MTTKAKLRADAEEAMAFGWTKEQFVSRSFNKTAAKRAWESVNFLRRVKKKKKRGRQPLRALKK